MIPTRFLLSTVLLLASAPAYAGQAPFAAGAPDFPVNGRDRVYAAEQFSNTVSVIDPSTNKNLGVIRLGDPQPMNLSPLTRAKCSSMGWASRLTARPSPSSRSRRTR
jgi:YVTN family beta-propeller protein